MAITYEVRFQTVDPKRRDEYVKHYIQALQSSKEAGAKGGYVLCSEDDPSSVLVLLEWETKEHHLRWRGTPPHTRFAPPSKVGKRGQAPAGTTSQRRSKGRPDRYLI
jgi:hypothetical protein